MLRRVARKIKSFFFKTIEQKVFQRIQSLSNSCAPHFLSNVAGQKALSVLWITNFNLEPRRLAHDAILILSLKMRGVKIIPVICDQAQSTECIYQLGKWQNSGSKDFEKRRKEICGECRRRDTLFWKMLNIEPLRIREYILPEEKATASQQAAEILRKDWRNYITKEGFLLGQHVQKAVLNGEMRGSISDDWKSQADAMAYHHIYNILILLIAYNKIFEQHQIDRVFGNGGYYYHWDVPFYLGNQKNISFYRSYPIGLRVFTWNYHKNNNELIDLSRAWTTWKEKPLTDAMQSEVEKHLTYRGINITHDNKLHVSKEVVLILTGVIWDANTLHEGALYHDMYEWLFDTLQWFEKHPERRAIMRVHPADNVSANVTGTTAFSFRGEMERRGYRPPSNVQIIWPEVSIETYELMQMASIGICYSSTTGLEFCCLGKPMIVLGKPHYSGKGFTLEPRTREEYYYFMLNYQALVHDDSKTLAYKYWYFYAFHASVDFNLLTPLKPASNWVKRGMSDFESDMKRIDYRDIVPGKNPYVDYICDSVINDEEIISETRWPPLCIEYN